jgi:NADH dehydrogenase
VSTRPKRILVLGGGFGGVHAAMRLERELADLPDVEIVLVSRENFFSFTPMLHEVAASDVDLTHVVNPVRKLLTRARFFVGDVTSVDVERRSVRVEHGSRADAHHHDLDYDHLVLALGAVTSYRGVPGLAEHAFAMKSLGDAIALRNQVIANLEEADTECSLRAGRRAALCTIVVAGAGFAGVETIGALNDFAREALRFYPHLGASDLRLALVHSGDEILPELDPRLGAYARERLAARGVEIHLAKRVSAFDGDCVELSDGTKLATRTLVWTAGTAPHPLLAAVACPKEGGRLRVDRQLRVASLPGVWALGDCAWVPDAAGRPHPPTAQHALRQAALVARNVRAELSGAALAPFEFATLGQLATIGRRAGVAQVFGFRFSGWLAWMMWRAIYLAKLPRAEKKVRVLLDWTLDLVFSKDLVQFATGRTVAGRG